MPKETWIKGRWEATFYFFISSNGELTASFRGLFGFMFMVNVRQSLTANSGIKNSQKQLKVDSKNWDGNVNIFLAFIKSAQKAKMNKKQGKTRVKRNKNAAKRRNKKAQLEKNNFSTEK